MAKNLKLNIKNTQIAQAVNISSLKGKIGKKKSEAKEDSSAVQQPTDKGEKKEEAPKIKARNRSAFADGNIPQAENLHPGLYPEETAKEETQEESFRAAAAESLPTKISKRELLPEIEEISQAPAPTPEALRAKLFQDVDEPTTAAAPPIVEPLPKAHDLPARPPARTPAPTPFPRERPPAPPQPPRESLPPRERLGPTGRHVKDLVPPPRPPAPPRQEQPYNRDNRGPRPPFTGGPGARPPYNNGPGSRPPYNNGPGGRPPYNSAPGGRPPYSGAPGARPPFNGPRPQPAAPLPPGKEEDRARFRNKVKTETTAPPAAGPKAPGKFREFRDIKPAKRTDASRQFDGRDRQGLRAGEDEGWRSKKRHKVNYHEEEIPTRPTSLKVRLPISIKDLAEKMKLKASQLISKLFLQGMVVTLNDQLADEIAVQLLGHEFGCEIGIDTSEEQRIRITDKSIKEEIKESDSTALEFRPPVVAFMGHVDHGKTSLIDAIRSTNRVAGEAGAITQHIGAFRCSTPVGDITILDTPGHEAFSAMRARGSNVTDIVVLVVAGDEGLRQQTLEAIQHAKAAGVIIVVAINKVDKPNFNAENVYRQLSEQELLPEAWGGQTITVNCSAVSKVGIKELLEMLALQAEVLELKANPKARGRGTVIESEMHKGMGAVATVLVQNGTLNLGDAIVFGQHFGRVKTMRNELGAIVEHASPSTPIFITGLSGLPDAGEEFIVVKNEKEARDIAEVRSQGLKQTTLLLKKKMSMDSLMQQAAATGKKILNLVLRADVQGSLEALKVALLKIDSQKAELNILFHGVGEISESDVQLAAASKAVIIGFHTQVEGHADTLIKELGIQVRLHDIIYHAIDDVKALMSGLLDKIPQETERGKAFVKALFQSSQYGVIAGCQVSEGSISRNNQVRVIRGKETIYKGTISSLKRVKEDVREVQKGLECGIVLANFQALQENDVIEAFEITYLTQEL